MINRLITFLLVVFSSPISFGQNNIPNNSWRAALHREDGRDIIFTFKIIQSGAKKIIYIVNGSEQIKVENTRFKKDSVFIQMPVFESSFKAKTTRDHWDGVWMKGTVGALQVIPFTAERQKPRFMEDAPARYNISGRWAVNFSSDHADTAASIAEFVQNGNKLTGTFLTPTGDYRYQEGIVSGNKFMLSGFDGAHAMLFTGTIFNARTIMDATFYSGAKYKESWKALKNSNATVSTDPTAMFLKQGEEKLNFSFPDLNGKLVSINDARFKNKVVIIQLMGSWCPNCMDETSFLSNYYNSHRNAGVEIISLAYEYSTDFNRSVSSLRKFQKRFNVKYPMLITGVTVKDSLRTQKTLPQVTDIKVFPSSIILDKKGKVRLFETDFFGQGTGQHYLEYTRKFNENIDKLLKEK